MSGIFQRFRSVAGSIFQGYVLGLWFLYSMTLEPAMDPKCWENTKIDMDISEKELNNIYFIFVVVNVLLFLTSVIISELKDVKDNLLSKLEAIEDLSTYKEMSRSRTNSLSLCSDERSNFQSVVTKLEHEVKNLKSKLSESGNHY